MRAIVQHGRSLDLQAERCSPKPVFALKSNAVFRPQNQCRFQAIKLKTQLSSHFPPSNLMPFSALKINAENVKAGIEFPIRAAVSAGWLSRLAAWLSWHRFSIRSDRLESYFATFSFPKTVQVCIAIHSK